LINFGAFRRALAPQHKQVSDPESGCERSVGPSSPGGGQRQKAERLKKKLHRLFPTAAVLKKAAGSGFVRPTLVALKVIAENTDNGKPME